MKSAVLPPQFLVFSPHSHHQLLQYLYFLDHPQCAGPQPLKKSSLHQSEGFGACFFWFHYPSVPFLWHWAELGIFFNLDPLGISGSQMPYFYPFLFWEIPLLSIPCPLLIYCIIGLCKSFTLAIQLCNSWTGPLNQINFQIRLTIWIKRSGCRKTWFAYTERLLSMSENLPPPRPSPINTENQADSIPWISSKLIKLTIQISDQWIRLELNSLPQLIHV